MESDSENLLILDSQHSHQCLGCGTLYRQRVAFCWTCARSGLVVARSWRPADAHQPQQSGISAKALAAMHHKTMSVRQYPEIIISQGALVFCHGTYGSGKSTAAVRWGESFSPCLYLPLEEGIGPVLADRIRRLEARSEHIRFEMPRTVSQVFEAVDVLQPKLLVVDSVQASTFTPDDLLSLSRAKKVTVLAIGQRTKDGQHAGSNRWPHLADVVIRVEAMRWRVEKSRYQPSGIEGPVLPEEPNDDAR